MALRIPDRLLGLLRSHGDAEVEAGTTRLAGAVGEILGDNKMPFFPSFTDHGIRHVEAVLSAAEKLVPKKVWKGGVLTQADAAVLIGATLLHDLALHVREQGFVELVAEGSRFEPLPWFGEAHGDRIADAPWSALWRDFRKEAQHFSRSQLGRVLGAGATVPAIAFGNFDRDPAIWSLQDRLLVGEFLRRHHARLAHEVAIYGFPGLATDQFHRVSELLPGLADAIGLTARSHNEDLRSMTEYLSYRARGEGRPFGALVPFLMGLLRVADFFQLEPDRASPLLMHLREPQSPASAMEWRKHQAIERISWVHSHDPCAVHIQVSSDISISVYLQLHELVRALQNEFDVTAAVLDETYGRSETSILQLSRKRVDTNLTDPGLIDQLGFVPRKAHPRSAEDLFRLVIADLYGNEPVIAGRELLQNAVDAVRELRRVLSEGKTLAGPLRELEAEVLVELREGDGESPNSLRVVDRGVGMTPDTIINNFLSAGAVVSGEAAQATSDSASAIAWMKTGRFGLGAFAAFLLGGEVQVTTRHFCEPQGVTFTAEYDDDLVQLNWAGEVPVGTEIVVPFDDQVLPGAGVWSFGERAERFLQQVAGYLQLQSPAVSYRVVPCEGHPERLLQKGEIPDPTKTLPPFWRSCEGEEFDAILWRLPPLAGSFDGFAGGSDGARLAHNGMVIRPVVDYRNMAYQWSSQWLEKNLLHPTLAIFDTRQVLGITLNRYELTERTLRFEDELLSSIGEDVVARAIAAGRSTHPLGKFWGLRPVISRDGWMPFVPALLRRLAQRPLFVVLSGPGRLGLMEFWLTEELTSDYSWKRLPYRAALPLLAPGQLTSGSPDEDISKRIKELSKRLGREVLASGYWSFEAGEPSFYPFQRSGVGRRAAMEEYLLTLGRELQERSAGELLGIAVLGRSTGSVDVTAEALAGPWIEAVGGPLESEKTARKHRMESIAENIPHIEELVYNWEQLLA